MIEVRIFEPGDADLLRTVSDGVFDRQVQPALLREFLGDPRRHLAVAVADGAVIGIASGVHYIHPDKPFELWINEVGVAPAHRRRGIGMRLLETLLGQARALGCRSAWVISEAENLPACQLYARYSEPESGEPALLFSIPLENPPDPGGSV
jgi:GNAT superfamily N-acetyltransferase